MFPGRNDAFEGGRGEGHTTSTFPRLSPVQPHYHQGDVPRSTGMGWSQPCAKAPHYLEHMGDVELWWWDPNEEVNDHHDDDGEENSKVTYRRPDLGGARNQCWKKGPRQTQEQHEMKKEKNAAVHQVRFVQDSTTDFFPSVFFFLVSYTGGWTGVRALQRPWRMCIQCRAGSKDLLLGHLHISPRVSGK